ncbi:MAG: DEAD/DEAH box helicase [Brevinematales bacterium]|nr:DEAD/DEAH box helicase [Brevinematales bacterium]
MHYVADSIFDLPASGSFDWKPTKTRKEEKKELRPYQISSAEAVEKAFQEFDKTLLVLPTGCGKTVIFADLIDRWWKENRYQSLVLAHRSELIDQAATKIRAQAGIIPGIEKADKYAYIDIPVVIASVQTLTGKRLKKYPTDTFKRIIVDEAHHAIAPSYKNILNYFNGAKVLGVTATPDRADNRELGSYFESIAYQYLLTDAIKDGWLVPIIGRRVQDFSIDLSELRTAIGDFLESELEQIIEKYISPICTSIIKETAGLKTMIFLPSVKSSELVAHVLRTKGINASFLSGSSTEYERMNVLDKFKDGKITHLCNCNLFLEGFDEPSIEAVVMARPTLSRTVYAQAIGRGTRIHPGKNELLLVEFTYNYEKHKLVNVYEIFAGKGYEQKVRDAAEKRSDGKRDINFLEELEEARKDTYDIDRIMERVSSMDPHGFVTYDPFALCDLHGVDLSGEFNIEWQGRKLTGHATPKQIAFLDGKGIQYANTLSKAQASILIDMIAKNGWKVPVNV